MIFITWMKKGKTRGLPSERNPRRLWNGWAMQLSCRKRETSRRPCSPNMWAFPARVIPAIFHMLEAVLMEAVVEWEEWWNGPPIHSTRGRSQTSPLPCPARQQITRQQTMWLPWRRTKIMCGSSSRFWNPLKKRRPARRKQEELSQICLLRPISTLLLAQIKPLLCPSLVQQQQCQVACLTHFPTRPLPLQLLLDLASDGPVLATFRQHLLPLPHPKHRVQPTMSWISSLLPLQHNPQISTHSLLRHRPQHRPQLQLLLLRTSLLHPHLHRAVPTKPTCSPVGIHSPVRTRFPVLAASRPSLMQKRSIRPHSRTPILTCCAIWMLCP
mmetsp:Transcript_68976/g.115134  ORF Transcript_68976/g.115134 Transcript_68976/m.115134 type:complete len:327 (-) Transcript_68976:428-1408(-)